MKQLAYVRFIQPHILNGLLHAAGCRRHVTEKAAKILVQKGVAFYVVQAEVEAE